MFLEDRVIKHYAKILFEYTKKNNFFHKNIKFIFSLLQNNINFIKFFNTKLLYIRRKIKIVKKIFYNFDLFIYNFTKFLILKNRENLLQKILLKYFNIYDRYKENIVICTIVSTYKLSEDIKYIIAKKIFNNKYSKIHINNKIDTSIIGGFILYKDYKEWDFSIKNNINKIKNKLNN